MAHEAGQKCKGITRRSFLSDTGMAVTGMALGAMLFKDGVANAELPIVNGRPHFTPRAKSV
ncbi:MAG: twin-arginine translocation signal domain-containing protein, partial [Chthonomonadales bacterium]